MGDSSIPAAEILCPPTHQVQHNLSWAKPLKPSCPRAVGHLRQGCPCREAMYSPCFLSLLKMLHTCGASGLLLPHLWDGAPPQALSLQVKEVFASGLKMPD